MRFRSATKLSREAGDVQVSSLIYALGQEADRIFTSFTFAPHVPPAADPRNDFDGVLAKFDEHFIPKRNVIHERAKFYGRKQQVGESVEEFLRSLHQLAATCEFADKEEEAIRDRLVIGLHDTEVSQKLQLEAALTLKTAADTARHYGLVKQQLKDQRITQHVDAASYNRGRPNQRRSRGRGHGGDRQSSASSPRDCGKCGRKHPPANCPAKGKKCRKCGKLSHFAAVCRSSQGVNDVAAGEEYQEEYGEYFSLGAVHGEHAPEPPWNITLNFCGRDTDFKIDTGADVSIISNSVFKALSPPPLLSPTNAVLRGPGGVIKTEGEFNAQVHHKDKSYSVRCFVVNTHTDNLLSRDAATHLGLIQRLDGVEEEDDPLFAELDKEPARCKPVHIALTDNATPYAVHAARRVPIPLLQKVKDELNRLKAAQVIEEVQEPTDWCAGMVPVLKKSGSVRICTDFKQLNKAVKRERYMLPTHEDILYKLHGSKVFSKLDATSGFFQLPLDDESAKLTTFITPFGRYFYRRLPQGITSAPEIFQRTVEGILSDQPHTVCFFDDILVFSENAADHKVHLDAAKQKLRDAGLKINKDKCEFEKTEIDFLGYRISGDGIQIDPSKIDAITQMPDPTNITELRRFIGMVNFLGRHIPNLSTVMRPLSQLLEKEMAWGWGASQMEAVREVKELITTAPTLVFYDPARPTIVSSDASCYGLGGVLLQEQTDGTLKPVAYCSRTLSPTEKRYAQIEKECLAVVWSCERFDRYLVGLPTFTIETDHKPLVPLINNRDLSETPLRCQRMLMRLARFNAHAVHTCGKNMHVADHLSRSPIQPGRDGKLLTDSITERVFAVTAQWPASDAYLEKLQAETAKDVSLQIAIEYTRDGWPEYKQDVKLAVRHLYAVRGELSVWNGILIKGERLVIPTAMQGDVLNKLHEGHMGINKCRERASQSVWWPHISQDIKDYIGRCRFCIEKQPAQKKEPLMPSKLPEWPFQRIGADICELHNTHFLICFDYYSRYIEISHLHRMTSAAVIGKLKNLFAHHGIAQTVITDNGPAFKSAEFAEFATDWNFTHTTSSPHYPQSNGAAEKSVQTAKNILRQKDVFRALLAYRATPIPELGASPAELAFGRKIRTTLPMHPSQLSPRTMDRDVLEQRDQAFKDRQKHTFDNHHGARPLPPLNPGDPVLIKLEGEEKWQKPAEVVESDAPRSYIVKTPDGAELRRNRRHLRLRPQSPAEPAVATGQPLVSDHHSPVKHSLPVPDQPPGNGGHPPDVGQPIPLPPPSPGLHTRRGRKVNLPARFRNE